MNILLDGHFLDKKKEGSRTFIYSYLEGLVRLNAGDRRLINSFSFVVPVFRPELWRQHFVTLTNVRFTATFRNALLRNHVDLPRQAAKSSAVVLQSIYYLPFFLPKSAKKILLIHDVLPFTHPHYFSRYFRCKFKTLVKLSQRQADHIVCVSNFSKAAIQNLFNIEDHRIRMIHNGINIDRYAAGSRMETLPYFGSGSSNSPFILVVGRLDPRKGLRTVLALFKQLLLHVDIRLILVGGRDGLPSLEMREVASLQAAGRLVWLQNISDEALASLYRQARLLLFFPAIEGFGLPVLEAMAAGLPYLTIAQGGLREVAIVDSWVDENDLGTMERKALQLLSDDEIRKAFINKGHEQAQKFRCEDMVRQYLQLYSEC